MNAILPLIVTARLLLDFDAGSPFTMKLYP
jgi:hypothetical protein